MEVLEAIYLTDMKLLKSTFPYKLEIVCKPFTVNGEINTNSFNVKVVVDLEKTYPTTGKPRVIFEPVSDVSQDHIAELERITARIVSRNSGT